MPSELSRLPEPEYSVVVPLHNEAPNLVPLVRGVTAALEPRGKPFEILLVNDGSTDETGETIDRLAREDPRLRPIHLAGRQGQAAAFSAGFALAQGGIVCSLDGDLQNDPADLPRLLERLETGGYQVVSGWRRERSEGYFHRVLPSRAANWLIARATGLPSRDNGCSLKAYRAEVIRGVRLPSGFHRYLPGVLRVTADEFDQVPVSHRPRRAGRSHYGLGRTVLVLRDLPALPYIRRDPAAGVDRMRRLGVAGGALMLGSGPLWGTLPEWAGGLCLGGLLLAAYAGNVSLTLGRWLRAQAALPYRLREEKRLPELSRRRAPLGS